MSRVAVASVAFAAALLNFLPLPAQTALAIHGHPQKASYASPAEWPFVSAQGHWTPANPAGTVGHTHVECNAPLYAEMPKTATITMACQMQLFHVAGRVSQVWGTMIQPVVWDTQGPVIGDPNGVVIRTFTATIDQSLGNPNVAPDSCPENGWCGPELRVRTEFTTGARTDVYLTLPIYAKGNPAVPEESRPVRLAAQVIVFSGPASRTVLNGHGTVISEFVDSMVPIAPLTTRMTAQALTFSYVLLPEFSFPLTTRHVIDPDLHHGIPGTTVFETANVAPPALNGVFSDVVFDPVLLGAGPHKVALVWDQQTLGGNASFEPGEGVTSLMVVTVNVGAGGPVNPPPSAVDCAGVKSWLEFSPGQWHQVFTVTQQPANGGKSCAVVVNGG